MADIIGGSPLTNALDVLSQKGLLGRTKALGGMNLPMALTASMMKDAMDMDILTADMIRESQNAIGEIVFPAADEGEEDI